MSAKRKEVKRQSPKPFLSRSEIAWVPEPRTLTWKQSVKQSVINIGKRLRTEQDKEKAYTLSIIRTELSQLYDQL
jgi:hypothetical protein